MDINQLIQELRLEPLEGEGGMYRATYASAALTPEGSPMGSAIYYLLTDKSFSHLHRLSADEIYHFYLGDPVELVQLLPGGFLKTCVLGQDIPGGQKVQALVPAGVWQGSRLAEGGRFALLGTTMSPGYTPACYEHGNPVLLMAKYPCPEAKEWIRRLTGDTVYR